MLGATFGVMFPNPDDSLDLQPNSMLGPYRVEKRLGEGAMGAVFEAVHARTEQRVALKVLHPDLARDPEVRTRFLREGRNAIKIEHPHVAQLLNVGEAYGIQYLVMELLKGETLEARLEREKSLELSVAIGIVLPVCSALAVVHSEGIVHRDIKPGNIFLAEGPSGALVPKLLDFGISKATRSQSAQITSMSQMLGTPHYMSPEQTQGSRNCDATTDQYALGVLLYECTTGQMPFDASELYTLMLAINKGIPAPARSHRPELPEAFDVLLTRALGKRPADRYPDILAFARALLPLAGPSARARWTPVFEPGSTASVPPPSDSLVPAAARHPLRAALIETHSPSVRPDPRSGLADGNADTLQDDNLELAIDEVLRSARRPSTPSIPKVGAPVVPGDLREPEPPKPPSPRASPTPAGFTPHRTPFGAPAGSGAVASPRVAPSALEEAPPSAPTTTPEARPPTPSGRPAVEGTTKTGTPLAVTLPALRPPPSAPPGNLGGSLWVSALVGGLVGFLVLGGVGWVLFR